MKLILVVLLTASPAAAVKPCAQTPPTPRQPCAPDFVQRKEIMSLIGNATGYYKDWSKAREEEQDLRDLISMGLSADHSRWKDQLERAEKAKGLLEAEFVQIAAKTQAAYRVGPNNRNGWVTDGLFKKDRAIWNPVLVLEDTYYEVIRPDQPTVYLRFKNKSTALAATLDDGSVILTIEARRRAVKSGSPASLAATFEHEGSHFDDLPPPRIPSRSMTTTARPGIRRAKTSPPCRNANARSSLSSCAFAKRVRPTTTPTTSRP